MKLALCMGFIWPVKPCRLSFDSFNEAKIMTASRRVIKFTIGKADLSELESIARSRTEPVGRVERARALLAYRQDPSFYAVGQALGMHHQKVQRYIERAKAEGALAALDERARPGTSRPRRGWWRWPAGRRRSWAIRMRCGRRGFWPAMPASMAAMDHFNENPV